MYQVEMVQSAKGLESQGHLYCLHPHFSFLGDSKYGLGGTMPSRKAVSPGREMPPLKATTDVSVCGCQTGASILEVPENSTEHQNAVSSLRDSKEWADMAGLSGTEVGHEGRMVGIGGFPELPCLTKSVSSRYSWRPCLKKKKVGDPVSKIFLCCERSTEGIHPRLASVSTCTHTKTYPYIHMNMQPPPHG